MRVWNIFLWCLVLFLQHVFGWSDLKPKGEIKEGCTVTNFADIPFAIEECSVIVMGSFEVPGGQIMQLSLRDDTTVIFAGNITFGHAVWEGPLVSINASNAIILSEDDVILDGQGELYWDGLGEWGSPKPFFFVMQLHNSIMTKMHILNPPMHCAILSDSSNVELSDWVIDSEAGDATPIAKNTDGFDVWNGTNIVIRNSYVFNQDDCVALRCGANMLVEDMTCYHSYGLSLSVGFTTDSLEQNTLENVTIRNSFLSGGRQAIHIKTHVDGGPGLLRNITYSNIEFEGVERYGVIIHENYQDPTNATSPPDPKNNVPIVDLTLENIKGTTLDSAVPIYVLCEEEGCFDWKFNNIMIESVNENNCTAAPEGIIC